MKISLSWLKKHLNTNKSITDITDNLVNLGLVVDNVQDLSKVFYNFIVAEVIELKKHPNADRLKVCKVNTGTKSLQVICGAPNVKKSMKVVLALPGAIIPESGIVIKKTSIRGLESFGMLCSSKELNLSGEQDAIIELDSGVLVGGSYSSLVGLDDIVIDVEITPNRGDCLSAHGLARDLSAVGVGTLNALSIKPFTGSFKSEKTVRVDLKENDICPVYVGRLIKNVKNLKSPQWLKGKLNSVNVPSISSIVDITNFLSIDLGQPMHTFDADKIDGDLTVTFANSGDKFTALDEKIYELDNSTLVIKDNTSVLAIAGIIGGLNSACSEETTNIFLESALFNKQNIIKTGRNLNINTDARYRFERGIDYSMITPAMEYATKLIIEYCGGEASDLVIIDSLLREKKEILFRPTRLYKLSGINLSILEIQNIFDSLHFKSKVRDADIFVEIPSWRHDISYEEDLIEEVLRIYGYRNIKPILPKVNKTFSHSKKENLKWNVRTAMATRGFFETLTFSFLRPEHAELFGGKDPSLIIVNPISSDLSVMRPSLLPNLISASKYNQNKGVINLSFFEVGPIYLNSTENGQLLSISGLRVGNNIERHWSEKIRKFDVFDVKADVLLLMEVYGFNTEDFDIIAGAPSWFHPGKSAKLVFPNNNVCGYFGEIHPKVLSYFDIKDTLIGFELFLSNLPKAKEKLRKKKLEIFPYPTVVRDFAFVVDVNVNADKILRAAFNTDKDLITDVNIFDIYSGKGMEEGKKSLAIEVKIEPKKTTMTDEEINIISQKIIDNVEKTTGGKLRS